MHACTPAGHCLVHGRWCSTPSARYVGFCRQHWAAQASLNGVVCTCVCVCGWEGGYGVRLCCRRSCAPSHPSTSLEGCRPGSRHTRRSVAVGCLHLPNASSYIHQGGNGARLASWLCGTTLGQPDRTGRCPQCVSQDFLFPPDGRLASVLPGGRAPARPLVG